MRVLVFCGLMLLPTFGAFADSKACSEVRLDKEPGSMSKLPREPYRQYDLNHCYAVTAAQMIDAYRFSHGDSQTSRFTSSIDLARRYKKEFRRKNNETIQMLNKNKDLFLKSVSKENYDQVVRSYWVLNPVLVKPVDTYSQDIIDFGYPHDVFTQLRQNGRIDTCDHDVADEFLKSSVAMKFANKTWREKKELRKVGYHGPICGYGQSNLIRFTDSINEALEKTNYQDFFGEVMDKVCADSKLQVQIPAPLVYFTDPATPETVASSREIIAKRMRAAFDLSNPQPVALSYCMEILSGNPANFPPECKFAHASVVIGRRPGKAGKCEYLIRNSTPNCLFGEKNCKDGETWLAEDVILSGAIDMSVIVDESAKERYEKLAH